MPSYERASYGLMPDMHTAGQPCALGMGAADTLNDLLALSDDLFSSPGKGLEGATLTPASTAPAEVPSEEGTAEADSTADKGGSVEPDEGKTSSAASASEEAKEDAMPAETVPETLQDQPVEPAAPVLVEAVPEKCEYQPAEAADGTVDAAAAAADAPAVTKGKRKTRICRLWLENRCRRRRCPFAHGKHELRMTAGDEECIVADAEVEGAETATPAASSGPDDDTPNRGPSCSDEAERGEDMWGRVLHSEGVAVDGRGPAELLGMCLAPDPVQQALRQDARAVLQGLLMGVDRSCTAKGAGASLEVGTFDSILDVVVEAGELPWMSCMDVFMDMLSARGIAARAFPERGEVLLFSHALGVVAPRYIESSFLVRILFCPYQSGVVSSARREAAAIHSSLRGSNLRALVPAILGVFRAHLPATLFAPANETHTAPLHHEVGKPAMNCECALGWCPCSAPQRPGMMTHDPYAVLVSVEAGPVATGQEASAGNVPSALAELCGLGQMERAVVVLFLAFVQHSRTHPNFDDAEWMFRSFFDFYAGLNFGKHVVRLHDRPFPPRAACAGEVAGRMEDGVVYLADLATSANLTPQLAASTLTQLFKSVAQSLRDNASLDTLVPGKLLERRNTVLFRPPPEAACAKQAELAAALARVAECLQEPENAIHTGAVRAALLGAVLPCGGQGAGRIAEQARAVKLAMNSGLW